MVIKFENKKVIDSLGVLLLFLASMLSSSLLMVWLVGITVGYVALEKTIGALKALVLIQIRSILSVGVAVSISSVSNIKWGCLFFLSLYIILNCLLKLDAVLNTTMFLLLFFVAYISISSFFVSSFPVVSIAKAISYAIPFAAIVCGVYLNSDFDWIGYYNKTLGFTLLASAVLLPFSVGYLRNGHAFQGAINHPNMYGIMLAVFLAGYFYKHSNDFKFSNYLCVFLSLFLIIQSESRTGFITASVVIFIYFIYSKVNSSIKILVVIFGVAFFLIGYQLSVFDFLTEFIYKGQDDIFYSRNDLIEQNMTRFYNNPLFGTGFNVPYVANYRSFKFSFDMIVENGNFITAIFGDLGIVGVAIFIAIYGKILKQGDKRNLALFVVPFMISMGEMVFFSSNNCALILYTYFGVYLASGKSSNKSAQCDVIENKGAKI